MNNNKHNKIKILSKNPEFLNNLKNMLQYLVLSKIDVDIDNLINNYSDLEIFAILHQLYIKKFSENGVVQKKRDGLNFSSRLRYKIVKSVIDRHYNNKTNIKILDVGTEDCLYIDLLDKIGTPHAINIETEKFASYVTDHSCIKYYDGVNIPFEPETMDIITCTMVIHHMDKPLETLKNIYDTLKKGGLLIIKEHDCNNKYTRFLIDIEHFIHAMIINSIFDIQYFNSYKLIEYTQEEMINMITQLSFTYMPTYLPKFRTIPRGATKKYYAVFKK